MLPIVNELYVNEEFKAVGLLQANSGKVPVQAAGGVPKRPTIVWVKEPPFTLTITVCEEATNLNHIVLLVPPPKHDKGESVPVIPALVYAAGAEQPEDETKIAVEQSVPVWENEILLIKAIVIMISFFILIVSSKS